jgi:hypothetical protein
LSDALYKQHKTIWTNAQKELKVVIPVLSRTGGAVSITISVDSITFMHK